MVENSRQALVGAIGGTFISLAIADIDELSIGNFALLNSADFHNPMEAIERYLKSLPRCPDKVGLSVAGHVEPERAKMSHLPWSFDWNDIRAVTGAQHVHFVNEFEALALAVPLLADYDTIDIGKGRPQLHGNRAVVSAGTGLGAAVAIWNGDGWRALSGESRFASFPPTRKGEYDIAGLLAPDGFLAVGQVLTGRGLIALHAALAWKHKQPEAKLTPSQITKAGLSGEDPAAGEALDLMATWLGRFAGDIALHYGATGGIYLAGGLPSNIIPALQTGRFRDAFEGEGDRHAYLGHIPVKVLKTGADAGLRGAAVALANSLPVRSTPLRRLKA